MIGTRQYSGVGLRGPVDDLKAQIQGYVAQFLYCRTQLQTMVNSPVLTISQKAQALLADQDVLEPQLQTALSTIQSIQAGGSAYSISDIGSVAAFVPMMVKQINDTNDLWAQYTGVGGAPSMLSSLTSNWWLLGAVALAVYLLFSGRKRG